MKIFMPRGNFRVTALVTALSLTFAVSGTPFPLLSTNTYPLCAAATPATKRLPFSPQRQAKLNALLLGAVRANNVRACTKLLAQRADANAQDAQGRTALMLAVEQKETEIVRLLLKQGARVLLKSQSGRTALADAVRTHDPRLLKILIASVPSGDFLSDPASLSVMALAAVMNDPSTVQELLRQGVNPKGEDCAIALAVAAEYGRHEVVGILLAAGTDVNYPLGPRGTTILMGASESPFPGQGKIVEALIKAGARISAQDAQGKTALMYAAASNSLETMQVLLAHGADATVKDKKGETAAQIPAPSGSHQAIVALLARAVSGTQDIGKRRELVAAVEHNDAATLKDLLSKGGDVNARDDAGETLLMKGATQGQLDLVNILLKYKADVKAKSLDSSGYTALVRAAEAGHADVVKALLDAGADPNVKINQGYTALARAGSGQFASEQGAIAVADVLLRHGADPNGKDDFGETELIQVATYGATGIAKLLLDHGSLINARDSAGNTALWRAANNGWPDMVDLLVQRGADVNIPGENGEKPLKVAYEQGAHLNAKGTEDYRRIVATLKKAGAQQ